MHENGNKKLTFAEKFAYGLGDCSANIVVALSGTFLSAYYTDTVGIAAAAVGTMLLVCRVFDGGSDLLMGALVDKTNSKYGKARPWMLWTAPLMAIGIYLLFNCPAGLSDRGNLVYAYLTYIFMMVIVYTANNLPFNALLSRMTLDVQDRSMADAENPGSRQASVSDCGKMKEILTYIEEHYQGGDRGRFCVSFSPERRHRTVPCLLIRTVPCLLILLTDCFRQGYDRRHICLIGNEPARSRAPARLEERRSGEGK